VNDDAGFEMGSVRSGGKRAQAAETTTAKALSPTIPPSLLATADGVIE
jgi:hypothetical protein